MMIQMTTIRMMTSKSSKDLALIILAAGSSSRMGGLKKEYLTYKGGTVLSATAKTFLKALSFSTIVITYPKADTIQKVEANKSECKKALFTDSFVQNFKDKIIFIPGGNTRQESVLNALEEINKTTPSTELVFIHDGARPFVSEEIINLTHDAALEYGASVPGLTPVDTQKEITDDGFISRHLTRANLTAVQTPQVFNFKQLLNAHRKAHETSKEYTDDTEIWGEFIEQSKIKVVKGSIENKKITYKQDLDFSEKQKKASSMIKIGLGYDKHRLIEDRKLMLGGIEIPSEKGEDGHSDGDVLLHAISDALLGASGLGDIGSFFPPSDQKWKDADSKELLKIIWNKVTENGWSLENIDAVIAIEKPKFLPHRQNVINSIANILDVNPNQIFVKAKTGEKIGDVGEGKVVEVWATCLLSKPN